MKASLKQLEALHWVAKLGSFQSAANRMHTTQSAVSKRIAELETMLGRSLFDRSRRTAQLTLEGKRVAAGAEELLELHRKILSSTYEPSDFMGEFRLAATELIGLTWLSKFVRRVAETYPGLRLIVEVDHGGRLLERLNAGKYDLALVPGPMWGRLFSFVPLRTLDRSWMASPSLNLPKRALSIAELSSYPVASQFPDTVHAQLQASWFQRSGYLLQPTLLANGITSLGEIVLSGLAIGQLPVKYYEAALKSGQLVRVRLAADLPNVKYFAVFRRTSAHELAPALARVAKAVCDFSAPRWERPL